MKTYKEVILETVEYYKANPRAKDEEGSCIYLSNSGSMCAVGRVMNEDALEKYGNFIGDIVDLFRESGLGEVVVEDEDECFSNSEDIVKLFKEEYQHLNDFTFWGELQGFHDLDGNWTKTDNGNELTTRGEMQLESLLKRYE